MAEKRVGPWRPAETREKTRYRRESREKSEERRGKRAERSEKRETSTMNMRGSKDAIKEERIAI